MTPLNKITVAIDGFASCGKSTIAKGLAKKLNYIYLDSGAMYRAVTLHILDKGIDPEDVNAIVAELPNITIDFQYDNELGTSRTILNGKDIESDIRTMRVSGAVSPVARVKEVRHAMVERQQVLGKHGGLIMDGRDIGTVVLPNAELKIFVTARIDVRTERRYAELTARGIKVTREQVAENLQERDRIDSTRKVSPLKQAEDAVVLDTSDLSLEEQLETAVGWVLERSEA